MNKRRLLATLCAVLAVSLIVFIFSNSLKTADASAAQSAGIVETVAKALIKLGFPTNQETLSFIIRKLAHFAEYFLLGGLIYTSAWLFGAKHPFVISLAICLAVCIGDEFLAQRVTEGRSPEIRDCVIDICGAVSASSILYLIKRKRYSNM